MRGLVKTVQSDSLDKAEVVIIITFFLLVYRVVQR